MGRRKPLPVLEKVAVTGIGAEGNAVARVNDQVVFVPMLIPGDVVDIRVVRKRRNYLEGRPLRFHEYSPMRQDPVCSHFGVCGGCKWQHLAYEKQLMYKEQQVRDNLQRIGRADTACGEPILGSENTLYYRNKLEFTFSSKRWITEDELSSGMKIENRNALGFHIPGMFDKVLDIGKCWLQPEPANLVRNAVRRFTGGREMEYYDLKEHKGFLRNLIIRNTSDGQVMVIVVFHHEEKEKREEILGFIKSDFPEITSLMYVINPKKNDTIHDLDVVLYSGNDHLTETIDGLNFRVGPKSFYQTNTMQAAKLYGIVKDYAGLTGSEVVYDLYSGTGTIACLAAGLSKHVAGIEYVEDAVADAIVNARINGISNVSFHAGDIKAVLSPAFIGENGNPDVIITDPPRAGMHADVVRSVLDASPSRIVYVSCNPATQSRDIHLLSEKYYLASFRPVDMFPQTHHIENVALLLRR